MQYCLTLQSLFADIRRLQCSPVQWCRALNCARRQYIHYSLPRWLWSRSVQCTEVRFACFLSGGFTNMAVINSPERKLAKRTSVQCGVTRLEIWGLRMAQCTYHYLKKKLLKVTKAVKHFLLLYSIADLFFGHLIFPFHYCRIQMLLSR